MKELTFGPVTVAAIKRMRQLGMPKNVRRFVIDSRLPGEPMRVLYECFGDPDMLEALLEVAEIVVAASETGAASDAQEPKL